MRALASRRESETSSSRPKVPAKEDSGRTACSKKLAGPCRATEIARRQAQSIATDPSKSPTATARDVTRGPTPKQAHDVSDGPPHAVATVGVHGHLHISAEQVDGEDRASLAQGGSALQSLAAPASDRMPRTRTWVPRSVPVTGALLPGTCLDASTHASSPQTRTPVGSSTPSHRSPRSTTRVGRRL